MSQLIKKPEMAGELIGYLEQQAAKGHEWVVYDTDNPISSKYELNCFPEESEALDFAKEYQQIWNWHEAVPIGSMIFDLKELEKLHLPASEEMGLKNPDTLKTTKAMNLNNLQDLKEEAKTLGFSEKTIAAMEENMKKNLPSFSLQELRPGDKGDLIVTPHFKQSGQSDYYYLNRFEVTQSVVKPLEEGHKYMVISGEKDKDGKFPVVKFSSAEEAIANFNKRETSAELAVGKDVAHKTVLAGMEDGKVNYVAQDFKKAMYNPPLAQNFWVEHGKGFTAEQAVNLVQGRAVYRDDLLSKGVPYKAWVMLDSDKPRDKHNNLVTRQFHDPGYGFDLNKALNEYKIKELNDPKKAEALETQIRNGNRPLITTEKDGKEVKMFIVAAVRYGKLNFSAENGRPEKREQFEKTPELSRSMLDRKPQQQQEQGMGMGR